MRKEERESERERERETSYTLVAMVIYGCIEVMIMEWGEAE